jgi:hypothetical protein
LTPRLRLAGAAAMLAGLWYFAPAAEPRMRLCGFHWLTGLDCPLCGLTRGLFALAKGHWAEAFRYNALTPLGFVLLFSLFQEFPGRGRMWSLGLIAFAVYGVWRVWMG